MSRKKVVYLRVEYLEEVANEKASILIGNELANAIIGKRSYDGFINGHYSTAFEKWLALKVKISPAEDIKINHIGPKELTIKKPSIRHVFFSLEEAKKLLYPANHTDEALRLVISYIEDLNKEITLLKKTNLEFENRLNRIEPW